MKLRFSNGFRWSCWKIIFSFFFKTWNSMNISLRLVSRMLKNFLLNPNIVCTVHLNVWGCCWEIYKPPDPIVLYVRCCFPFLYIPDTSIIPAFVLPLLWQTVDGQNYITMTIYVKVNEKKNLLSLYFSNFK